jgi:ribosomal protein S18 acetylase RimI-like enzyme
MNDVMPRSLVRATDIDVLPVDKMLERRERYLVVRSPANPGHYWGNLLVMDDPPASGDGVRWERLFDGEFGEAAGVRHRTFAWDRADGALGEAQREFVERGYELEEAVGLVAAPDAIRPHPRENREVAVRPLDPEDEADHPLWEQVVALQVAGRDARFDEREYQDYVRIRISELRTLFKAGRGSWYVALEARSGEVLGSCGVVVTGRRARFQAVDTAAAHRRRGICSRLVVAAAHDAAQRYGARRLVIVADPDYHALGLYESLGFERRERAAGVCLRPDLRAAAGFTPEASQFSRNPVGTSSGTSA